MQGDAQHQKYYGDSEKEVRDTIQSRMHVKIQALTSELDQASSQTGSRDTTLPGYFRQQKLVVSPY